MLDTVARQVDSDSTYWWFLVGSVNSADGGVRRINLSYGGTNISGAFITTGVVQSQDGKTQLDLDAGTFKGRLQFLSADESEYIPLTVLNAKAEASKVKTDLIKNWALQDDIIAAMEYGDTFIEGGYVKTVFLDVDTIVANGIYAATIEALDVNFVKGTIGGIEINAGNITSSNGNFSVTSGGALTAKSGTFGNILIEATQIRSANNKFILTDAGALSAVDATITGTFKTGASGVRAEMTSSGITFFDGAGNYVAMSTVYGRFGLTVDDGGSNYSALSIGGLQTTGDITVYNGGDFKNGMTYDLQYKDWSNTNKTARYWRGVLVQVF